jgi:hypothetical protein
VTGAHAARVIGALAIGLMAAACSVAPDPSPLPATPRPPSPASSGSLGPASTPAPLPAGLAEWQQLPPQSGLGDGQLHSVVSAGDRFLGLGCLANVEGCELPDIWESDDGLAWRTAGPVFLPPDATSGVVLAAVSSQLGTVAAGRVARGEQFQASIWIRDRDGWVPVTPQSAADATVAALLAADGRVFAVGSGAFTAGFKAWWSADGATWQAASSARDEFGGYPTDLLPVGDALLAWGTSYGDPETTLWWRTVDGTAWQRVEAPRGLAGAIVTAIGKTQQGFEAFGSVGGGDLPLKPAAWVAGETAADWQPVDPPPQPGQGSVRYRLPVGQGSVAAGNGPPGPGREQQTGLVWLRGPGETTWREPVVILDFDVLAMIQDPDQLNRVIVIGRTFEGLRESTVIWTGLVDWAP